jgi:signal transduction histidine kinase
MTIRTRLSLWYAAIMFIALLAMGALSYYEFVFEPRREAAARLEAKVAEAEEEGDFADVLRIVLWCGVPAGVLALGGGWWLMRKSLAPVTALTHAAAQINERNLKERLPCSGNGDELDRLTEVFNAMTARLDDSFQRIREFTLHASHELKTPLTVLCGETETALRDAPLTPGERERCVSQLDELRRLGRIVDGLTLLTRADAGLLRLAFEPVRLDELVRDNFADAEILAAASGVEVKLAACEPALVLGDRHRLRQLLLNLADNAVKYNQSQGRVTMALLHDANTAEFVITNTGPGIPPEILPRVFDRFFRGDPAHESTVEGCGLGLSIAQWIVRAHNGTITITSAPSQQTTVTMRLPLARENKSA